MARAAEVSVEGGPSERVNLTLDAQRRSALVIWGDSVTAASFTWLTLAWALLSRLEPKPVEWGWSLRNTTNRYHYHDSTTLSDRVSGGGW